MDIKSRSIYSFKPPYETNRVMEVLSMASNSGVMAQTILLAFGSSSAPCQVADLTWSIHKYLLSICSQVDQLHGLKELIQESRCLHCRLGKGLALFFLPLAGCTISCRHACGWRPFMAEVQVARTDP